MPDQNNLGIVEQTKALFAEKGGQVEIGRSFFFSTKGWLTVEDKGKAWQVMYTNGKETHQPLSGPALMVDFDKATGQLQKPFDDWTGAWKATLFIRPVRDQSEADQIFDVIKSRIEKAYEYNLG